MAQLVSERALEWRTYPTLAGNLAELCVFNRELNPFLERHLISFLILAFFA